MKQKCNKDNSGERSLANYQSEGFANATANRMHSECAPGSSWNCTKTKVTIKREDLKWRWVGCIVCEGDMTRVACANEQIQQHAQHSWMLDKREMHIDNQQELTPRPLRHLKDRLDHSEKTRTGMASVSTAHIATHFGNLSAANILFTRPAN